MLQSQVDTLQAEIRSAALEARSNGTSWREIGAALGFSPQAAQQRFGKPRQSIEELPLSDPVFDVLFTAPKE